MTFRKQGLVFLLLTLLITACGQRGPLFLPPPKEKAPQQRPQEAASNEVPNLPEQ